MKINHAEIVISAAWVEQYPTGGLPEFALAGRSNVGKSSFINKMIGRKSLARISSKPGKTQTLNFYSLNEKLMFVDVPGYGYAAVSKKQREAFGKMLEEYFSSREVLRAALLIVDLHHPPSKDDVLMYDFLKHYQVPCIVVATKADKVPRSKHDKHLKIVRETLGMNKTDDLILFSSETGVNSQKIWGAILSKV